MNAPIGVIDSGVGGLTVAKEMMRQLPNETIYYVGDTARCPYGPRPVEEVKKFTWQMIRFLMDKQIKMLVIACNTATAVILDEVREELKIPVLGVIYPGARAALKHTKNFRIGVLGTVGTIKSQAYERALKSINKKVRITALACPKFVPLVESGQYNSPIAKKIVAETLYPIQNCGIDTVILGCTHYPLLGPIIKNVMGAGVSVISSGEETAREVSTLLYFHDLFNMEDTRQKHRFYTTGSSKIFAALASDWLEQDITCVETIQLGETLS
ncbi:MULTISPECIES: glutamate racemase [Heyndrickxia]|uniref:Glutamate racemase n=2 Tax=Heyndrickxia coagulans TaxID=1398 RepID=A0A150JQA0_HEYCO|nr:glutamate racemase [Heyndrickxia coagulans]AEH53963.1 glutamate racemase [Heyndrickxia coagulans 2-6]AJH79949.1 glutamate racemase [Heyndrickxia coagulans DSM 1 = ATCC 7050]KYC59409.1 Glutamate racemase [Heyndrickxia coagulans]KYC73818.1 Glutamate racemase [Heyndrickxia coagulans]MBF8417570.1 glutamate racemase [Heyndrickxia coagulans]